MSARAVALLAAVLLASSVAVLGDMHFSVVVKRYRTINCTGTAETHYYTNELCHDVSAASELVALAHSDKIACAANSVTSTWTYSVWNATDECEEEAYPTVTGNDTSTCVEVAPDESVLVDCSDASRSSGVSFGKVAAALVACAFAIAFVT